ncbi:MAG: division/cell wall cluster transcriptional repressor MraZ [Acutalibacteraceae bacterium]|nr:division/cell wall cluster transcriptional repressor MraZ [Acutalibacteraceae bacterium]
MFIGTYQHNIDAKGRVIIPAKFREELGDSFYVTMGINNCLFVLSKEKWEVFLKKLEEQPMAKAIDIGRFFCAGATEAVPNAQGRVLIPDTLRKYAKLDKDVTVIGAGSRVEIWNTEKWNEYIESQTQQRIKDAMELLGI